MIKSLSIVMPCYNEEEAIPQVIPRTIRSLNKLIQKAEISDYELILVDDQSTDRSVDLLQNFEKIKIIKTEGPGRGYGKALKTGFCQAKGTWIGFLDVDNSYRPEDFRLFIKEIKKGQFDFIMGQRGLDEQGMSFTRGLGNWIYVVLAQVFYGSQLDDVCSGFRFFHRKHLNDILAIREDGLDFSIELTLQMINQKVGIKTIPIQYDERLGDSKLSVVSDGLSFLKVLMLSKMRQTRAPKHSRMQ